MSEGSERSSARYPTDEELRERASAGDRNARSIVQARQIETGPMAHRPDATPTDSKGKRKMSAAVLKLAERLGSSPDELAAKIPEDTIRRTKYPSVAEKQPDGSIVYKHIPLK